MCVYLFTSCSGSSVCWSCFTCRQTHSDLSCCHFITATNSPPTLSWSVVCLVLFFFFFFLIITDVGNRKRWLKKSLRVASGRYTVWFKEWKWALMCRWFTGAGVTTFTVWFRSLRTVLISRERRENVYILFIFSGFFLSSLKSQ